MAEIEQYFTVSQVASALGRNERTIRRWIDKGEIEAVKIPGRWGGEIVIPASSLHKLGITTYDNDRAKFKRALERIAEANDLVEARRLAKQALVETEDS